MTTYATDDELSRRLDLADSTTYDVEIADAIGSASRSIDAYCGRVFYKDTTATARVYWPRWDYDLGGYVVDLDPDVWSITSVKHDSGDDGTYETTWTNPANYLTLPTQQHPRRGDRDAGRGAARPSRHLPSPFR